MKMNDVERGAAGVAVYCAASTHIAPEYFGLARSVGRLLAQAGVPVVNGGGAMGLMGAVNDGANAAGGLTVGVIPRFMYDNGWHHRSLGRLEIVETMHERKARMAALTRAALALPGGIGTLEELLEIITWRKLALYGGNVVILNHGGFYDNLIAMLEHCRREGFIQRSNAPLFRVAATAEEAVAMALAPEETPEIVSPYADADR